VEYVVAPDLDEIVEANEPARHTHSGVGNGQQDAVDERVGDEEREQQDSRQHQTERQPTLVLEQTRDWPTLRRGDIFLS